MEIFQLSFSVENDVFTNIAIYYQSENCIIFSIQSSKHLSHEQFHMTGRQNRQTKKENKEKSNYVQIGIKLMLSL